MRNPIAVNFRRLLRLGWKHSAKNRDPRIEKKFFYSFLLPSRLSPDPFLSIVGTQS